MTEDSSAAPAPTRGERNNNPGNIEFEKSVPWLGQLGLEIAPPGAAYAPRFARFDTALNGIRALARQLLTDQRIHRCNTCREIVARWAPAAENDTGAYLAAITGHLGVDADASIDLADPARLAAFASAIILHENGRCLYDAATLAAAVDAALGTSVPTPKGNPMNPAANAATSSGVAGATVVILVWVLAMIHLAVPPEVAAAFGSLLTAGGGYFLHTRTKASAAPQSAAKAP